MEFLQQKSSPRRLCKPARTFCIQSEFSWLWSLLIRESLSPCPCRDFISHMLPSLAEKQEADSAGISPWFTLLCSFSFCLCRLQMIADQLVERFVASGLMLKEWDRVKLHATVMNTLFRKDPSGAYTSSLLINAFEVEPPNRKCFCWLLCFFFRML